MEFDIDVGVSTDVAVMSMLRLPLTFEFYLDIGIEFDSKVDINKCCLLVSIFILILLLLCQ